MDSRIRCENGTVDANRSMRFGLTKTHTLRIHIGDEEKLLSSNNMKLHPLKLNTLSCLK